MASDSRKPNDALTIADLCEAIAEHEVPYTLRDGLYQPKTMPIFRWPCWPTPTSRMRSICAKWIATETLDRTAHS
jgi:hypothetical protein